jgi:hypothetical protein
VRAEVATRLGYDPFFIWAERIIVAQVWRDSKGYRAAVQLVDAKGLVSGSRSLRSPSDDCREVVKAAALAISIGIDPESATRAPGTPPQPVDLPPATEPTPRPASDESSKPMTISPVAAPRENDDVPLDPENSFRVEAGAGLWSALNLAPAVSFGGTVFGGFGWRSFVLFAEVRKNLAASGSGVAADLLAGAILPCARYQFLFACAEVSWGELRLQGDVVKSVTYAAVGGRLGAQTSVESFVFRAHFDVLGTLDKTVVLLNGSEAWRLPPAAVALGMDAAWRF